MDFNDLFPSFLPKIVFYNIFHVTKSSVKNLIKFNESFDI